MNLVQCMKLAVVARALRKERQELLLEARSSAGDAAKENSRARRLAEARLLEEVLRAMGEPLTAS